MTSYLERLRPSPSAWLLVPVGTLMAAAATYPLGLPIAIGVSLVAGVAIVVGLARRPKELRVEPAGFHAGPAYVEPEHLGKIEALDAEATRKALGPELRADAWVLHSAWIRTAIRVQIDDEADTTPYWVVSTRRPSELAAALVACRDARGSNGQAAHSEQTG